MSGPVTVTDHALLRWLERVHKIDIDGLRSILREEVRTAVEMGAARLKKNGFEYRICPQTRALVTIVDKPVHHKAERFRGAEE